MFGLNMISSFWNMLLNTLLNMSMLTHVQSMFRGPEHGGHLVDVGPAGPGADHDRLSRTSAKSGVRNNTNYAVYTHMRNLRNFCVIFA